MNHKAKRSLLVATLASLALVVGAIAWADGAAQPLSDKLQLGKAVFEERAGGVGCAFCHGIDARGNGTAGVNAPAIVGAQESALRSSLAGAVPMMGFITLTEEELHAVVQYLVYLAEAPGSGDTADGM